METAQGRAASPHSGCYAVEFGYQKSEHIVSYSINLVHSPYMKCLLYVYPYFFQENILLQYSTACIDPLFKLK
jgi:hypothetical protein